MSKVVRLTLLFLLITLACSCAQRTLVALAPDPDGKVGSILVTNEAGSVAIDTSYQATTIVGTKEGPTAPENLGKEAVDKIFAQALSIQPKRPLHFLLYFEKDIQLTSESMKLLPAIVAAIRERNSLDISVIGHTDTVGSKEYNTELSNRRAVAIMDSLVRQGVAEHTLRTTSHGKENPLIPTADNVNEPRNRRVEVDVR
jgi:outer membrane protein OmpA-like peptidoglycan-associated protein